MTIFEAGPHAEVLGRFRRMPWVTPNFWLLQLGGDVHFVWQLLKALLPLVCCIANPYYVFIFQTQFAMRLCMRPFMFLSELGRTSLCKGFGNM